MASLWQLCPCYTMSGLSCFPWLCQSCIFIFKTNTIWTTLMWTLPNSVASLGCSPASLDHSCISFSVLQKMPFLGSGTGGARNPLGLSCFPLNQFGSSTRWSRLQGQSFVIGIPHPMQCQSFVSNGTDFFISHSCSLHNLNTILSWDFLYQMNQFIPLQLNSAKLSRHG